MKILLSMAMTNEMDAMVPPLGLLLLHAVLEQRTAHEVQIVFQPDLEDFLRNGERELDACDVFGFSTNSFSWHQTRRHLEQLRRRRPDLKLILGGSHATCCHEYCLRSTPADIVVRGEAEITLPLLLDALERDKPLEGIAGITFKTQKGEIVVNPDRPQMGETEMAALPIPSYELIPPGKYGYAPMETSRGCYFKCIFCAIPFGGLRFFTLDRVTRNLEVISRLKDRFEQGGVFISDDSFAASKDHVEKVLRLFTRDRCDLSLGVEVRITDILKHDLVALLDECRYYLLQVGIECGYDQGLRRVRKGLTVQKTLEFVERCSTRSFHHEILLSFIIGFPWEGEAEVRRSIDFGLECARSLRSRIPQINNFAPYPGTEIVSSHSKYGLSQVPPSFYDDPGWHSSFLGFTRIAGPVRERLFHHLQQSLVQHELFLRQGLPPGEAPAVMFAAN